MGRIPKSKKQKKLKFVDPCYKGPPPKHKKNSRILPNDPPKCADEQKMSRGMEEFFDLKNKAKQNKLKRRKRKKAQKDDFIIVKNHIVDIEQPGMERKVKSLPAVVKQEKFENKYQFFNRLHQMVQKAQVEAKIETKYNIELKNIDEEGNAEYVNASEEVEERKSNKRKKFAEKMKEKKLEKKFSKEYGYKFDLKKERVLFGEVASAPPVLTAKLKKAPEFNKAGKRQLVLKNMFPSIVEPEEKNVAPLSKKWKNMQPELKKNLEIERLRAVQLYRMMKSKKAS
ncbi:uncharacterized protein TNIN_52861 [Trichonephila inaurata madagascariensis]|uniref:Coiled-coil domain-containing protein 137 n=1 Tax=Trichonephila inaurata madagascariensis TaxID=2747483 RepID=A0A8X7BVW0_9ARAC|nr:uncharacterized protein TNIN_52861 [Trichonephila inaurata madagascariensis]